MGLSLFVMGLHKMIKCFKRHGKADFHETIISGKSYDPCILVNVAGLVWKD